MLHEITDKINMRFDYHKFMRYNHYKKNIIIGVPPKERFVDLVLVETDPNNGELITNSEKDPTKWGDWQNGGRVSDF